MTLTLDRKVTNGLMIGKSYFLSYLLVLRLLEGLPTVFLTPYGNMYIFAEGNCTYYKTVQGGDLDLSEIWESFRDAPNTADADWWVLLDTPNVPLTLAQQIQEPRWTFVHAVSPGSLKQAKVWSKNMTRQVYYMDIWTKEELYFVG